MNEKEILAQDLALLRHLLKILRANPTAKSVGTILSGNLSVEIKRV